MIFPLKAPYSHFYVGKTIINDHPPVITTVWFMKLWIDWFTILKWLVWPRSPCLARLRVQHLVEITVLVGRSTGKRETMGKPAKTMDLEMCFQNLGKSSSWCFFVLILGLDGQFSTLFAGYSFWRYRWAWIWLGASCGCCIPCFWRVIVYLFS